MKNNFEQAFKWLMVDEGTVYTNDAADSGGPTRFGITLKDYQLHINKNGTANDVANLTMAQAKTIYKGKYWDAIGADTLPAGVDNACFNYGVLAGIGRPIANIKRFADIKDADKKIDAMCDEMKTFLNNLATRRPKDERFRKGWNARVDRLRKNSHSLASTKTGAATGAVIIGGAIVTAAAPQSYWDMFTAHWVAYSLSALAVAFIVDIVIYSIIRNKKNV